QGTVTGTVKDDVGTLPGVSIQIKGTTQGTVTDVNGKFSLNVPEAGTVLIFSFVGYTSLEIALQGQKTLEVTLIQNAMNLSEIVVIGYGTQKKSDNTGAVATVSSDKFNKGMAFSPEQLLNGKTAGVQIISTNGQPGSSSSIRIRGTNSITAGSEPLFVIDGVPVDNNRKQLNLNSNSDNGLSNGSINPLVMLAPEDIETMTVLKDASATAIYGSRGANGVIMITTKKGVAGEVKLSYDGSFGMSKLPKKLDILSADEYKSAVTSKGLSTTFGTANTDWQDEIYRTAYSQSHNVAFSGGSPKTQYRVSLGAQNQAGIIIGTDMKRYNARVNVSQRSLNDKLKFQFNLANTNYNSNNLIEQQTGGFRGGVLNNVFKMDPTQPVTNEDGTYHEYSNDVRNPVALQNQVTDYTQGNRVIGNLETELTIFSDLKAKLNLAYDRDAMQRNIYQPIASSIGKDVHGRGINTDQTNASKLLEFYLTYNKQIDKHLLNVLGGYSWQQYDNYFTNTTAEGYSNDNLGYNSMDVTGTKTINIVNEANRLISFFGRVNYSYSNRYMLTATLRTDGSSRFGKDNQYGLFPSVGFAWRAINEEFMKNNTIFSDLKVRLG
ncbi:MAG: SusC/RagA family TonB-linked outer membrane protein, partial [Bacteroidales bacterium]